LALAATGQFVSTGVKDLKNELAGGLPGPTQGETTLVPAPEAISSTPLAPEVVPPVVPPEGGLTQVASNATRTDVPIEELMPGQPGYVNSDGTVVPAAINIDLGIGSGKISGSAGNPDAYGYEFAPGTKFDNGMTYLGDGGWDINGRTWTVGREGWEDTTTPQGQFFEGLASQLGVQSPFESKVITPEDKQVPLDVSGTTTSGLETLQPGVSTGTSTQSGGLPVDQTLQDAYVNPQTPTKEVTLLPVTPPSGDALLDQYVNPQTVTPEVTQQPVNGLPSTVVANEGYDPLPPLAMPSEPSPGDINQQINDILNQQNSISGVTPVPDVTNADFTAPMTAVVTPSDPYGEAYPETPPSDPYGDGWAPPIPGYNEQPSDPYGDAYPIGGGGGGLPTTPVTTPTTPVSTPTTTAQVPTITGGLPSSGGSPTSAQDAMNKTLGLDSNQNYGDPSKRAYLSPAVLATQGGGKAYPTYAQLIPQLASVLSQRGYADGGQVDADPSRRVYLSPVVANTQATGRANPTYSQLIPQVASILDQRGYADGGQVDDYFAQILAQRGYPVEMVPGPEDRMYRRHMKRGFAVNGPGTGQSDDIPTMLADGEYVIDADTVAQLGDGSSKAGAQVLDRFREEIRKHKRSAPVDKIPPKAKSPLEYMKAAQKGKKNG
jgi:hypothetical protein